MATVKSTDHDSTAFPVPIAARLAWFALPMLYCLWLNWLGVKTWFTADDFAWLGLRLQVHDASSLARALFHPYAQGTVRTLSERAYFLILSSLFGLNVIPFRVVAFATEFAAIGFLMAVLRRISGSAAAAMLAPVLWCSAAPMAQAMSWSSAYNEILCALLLFAAFYFLLRHMESGKRGDLAGVWICYLLGFGALEHIVVFPILAAVYALCFQRHYFRRTLPLFVPAVLFMAVHVALIPPSTDPLYRLYFDAGMFDTLRTYWFLSTAAFRPIDDWTRLPHPPGLALSLTITFVLLGYAAFRAARRDYRGVFLLVWYFALLSPVIPLRNHIQDYYLTLPLTGLAMLGASAIAESFQARRAAATAGAVVLASLYLAAATSALRFDLRWNYEHARSLRYLIQDIYDVHEASPGKIILLDGVNDQLFWAGLGDHPFRLLGIPNVYLAPGTEADIEPHLEWGGIADYVISPSEARKALDENRAIALVVGSRGVIEATAAYRKVLGAEMANLRPMIVDLGDEAYAPRLGPEWYTIEKGFRWMPRSASVIIGAPASPGMEIVVTGYCPAAAVAAGPVHFTVAAGGQVLGSTELRDPDAPFVLAYPLPPSLPSTGTIPVTLSVDRVFTVKPDVRPLGLAVRRIEIKHPN